VGEYAKAGIPVYLEAEIRAGHALTVSQPFAMSFDPRSLTDLD
jgi:hypothetical protein